MLGKLTAIPYSSCVFRFSCESNAFARAFDVEPPSLKGLSAAAALEMYREFTASCMEIAQEDAKLASYLRERLGEQALALGRRVRGALPHADAFLLARFLYRGIGIEIAGELPGTIGFCPCYFAQRYTPGDCLLMSAFDEGILRGICGIDDAELVFSCRLTQGSSSCAACFGSR